MMAEDMRLQAQRQRTLLFIHSTASMMGIIFTMEKGSDGYWIGSRLASHLRKLEFGNLNLL